MFTVPKKKKCLKYEDYIILKNEKKSQGFKQREFFHIFLNGERERKRNNRETTERTCRENRKKEQRENENTERERRERTERETERCIRKNT